MSYGIEKHRNIPRKRHKPKKIFAKLRRVDVPFSYGVATSCVVSRLCRRGQGAAVLPPLNFSMVCIVPAAYLMAPKRYSDEDCLGILRQVEVALAGRAVAPRLGR